MKIASFAAAGALSIAALSCAAPHPREAFQAGRTDALVIESLDDHSARVLSPVALAPADDPHVLDALKSIEHKSMAIVILENYRESEPGKEFRRRSVDWFVGLRQMGYQRIVFLQGQGVIEPNGLQVLAQYY